VYSGYSLGRKFAQCDAVCDGEDDDRDYGDAAERHECRRGGFYGFRD